jgi:hypothetical protein
MPCPCKHMVTIGWTTCHFNWVRIKYWEVRWPLTHSFHNSIKTECWLTESNSIQWVPHDYIDITCVTFWRFLSISADRPLLIVTHVRLSTTTQFQPDFRLGKFTTIMRSCFSMMPYNFDVMCLFSLSNDKTKKKMPLVKPWSEKDCDVLDGLILDWCNQLLDS